VTLKPGLWVIKGLRNRHSSIRHLWLSVNVPYQLWAYLAPFPSKWRFE